jgi:hypothetical protein
MSIHLMGFTAKKILAVPKPVPTKGRCPQSGDVSLGTTASDGFAAAPGCLPARDTEGA